MLHHVMAWQHGAGRSHPGAPPRRAALLGYDLLDTGPVRLLHFDDGHDTRLIRPGRSRATLSGCTPPTSAQGCIGRLVVRFAAGKAA
jgi:hypothetical protein